MHSTPLFSKPKDPRGYLYIFDIHETIERDGKRYFVYKVGYTSDLERRAKEHAGASLTKPKLLFSAPCLDMVEAEAQIFKQLDEKGCRVFAGSRRELFIGDLDFIIKVIQKVTAKLNAAPHNIAKFFTQIRLEGSALPATTMAQECTDRGIAHLEALTLNAHLVDVNFQDKAPQELVGILLPFKLQGVAGDSTLVGLAHSNLAMNVQNLHRLRDCNSGLVTHRINRIQNKIELSIDSNSDLARYCNLKSRKSRIELEFRFKDYCG